MSGRLKVDFVSEERLWPPKLAAVQRRQSYCRHCMLRSRGASQLWSERVEASWLIWEWGDERRTTRVESAGPLLA